MSNEKTPENNELDPSVLAVVNALNDPSRFQPSYVKQNISEAKTGKGLEEVKIKSRKNANELQPVKIQSQKKPEPATAAKPDLKSMSIADRVKARQEQGRAEARAKEEAKAREYLTSRGITGDKQNAMIKKGDDKAKARAERAAANSKPMGESVELNPTENNVVEFVYENNQLVQMNAYVDFTNELPSIDVIEKYRGTQYVNENFGSLDENIFGRIGSFVAGKAAAGVKAAKGAASAVASKFKKPAVTTTTAGAAGAAAKVADDAAKAAAKAADDAAKAAAKKAADDAARAAKAKPAAPPKSPTVQGPVAPTSLRGAAAPIKTTSTLFSGTLDDFAKAGRGSVDDLARGATRPAAAAVTTAAKPSFLQRLGSGIKNNLGKVAAGAGGFLAGTLAPLAPQLAQYAVDKLTGANKPQAPAGGYDPGSAGGADQGPADDGVDQGPVAGGDEGPVAGGDDQTPGQGGGAGGAGGATDSRVPGIKFQIKNAPGATAQEVGRGQFEKEYRSGAFGGRGEKDLDIKFKVNRGGKTIEIGSEDPSYNKFMQQYKQMQGAVYEALIRGGAQLRDDGWYYNNELVESVVTSYDPKPIESAYYYDSTGRLRVMSESEHAELGLAELVVEKTLLDTYNLSVILESNGLSLEKLYEEMSLDSEVEEEEKDDEEDDDEMNEAAKLDAVGKETDDIDNDGDMDKTDDYLHNRRKAIAAAIKSKGKK